MALFFVFLFSSMHSLYSCSGVAIAAIIAVVFLLLVIFSYVVFLLDVVVAVFVVVIVVAVVFVLCCSALRVLPAETRLTVYRRPPVNHSALRVI